MDSNLKKKLILLVCAIFVFALIYLTCSSRSKFGDAITLKEPISDDTVIIFHMPGCGHCINAMSEFKDAENRGNGKIVLIDGTKTENKELAGKLKVEGFPTIVKGDGTKYSGARLAEPILDFSKS